MGCQRPGQVEGPGLGSYLGQLAHGQERGFEAYCLERSALCHSGARTRWQLKSRLLPAPQSKLGAARSLGLACGSQRLGLCMWEAQPRGKDPGCAASSLSLSFPTHRHTGPLHWPPARTTEADDWPVVPQLESK